MIIAEPLPAVLEAFLHDRVNPAAFHHADHVRVAFELLRRHPFLDAAQACANGLRRITTRAGRPAAYHETITLAFLAVIGERLTASNDAPFETFIADNPDLMDPDVLKRWYGADRLASAVARATFVLPDATA